MRYHALACDYDGTIATDGKVDSKTIDALRRLKDSGRKLILVTGRVLPDLFELLPEIEIFDRVVAEDGALLYCPESRKEKVLAETPPPEFVNELKRKGVDPIIEGRSIVATFRPHEMAVFETIRDQGLEFQIIFNKNAVMVLPSGVNKAFGLRAALKDIGLSAHNVAGIGDAENDHAFLTMCECSAAVANALRVTKESADIVTSSGHGEGTVEFVDMIVDTDLSEIETRSRFRDESLFQQYEKSATGESNIDGGGDLYGNG